MRRELVSFASGPFQLIATVDLPDLAADQKVPAVLFCHGFTGNRIESRRSYARLGAALAQNGVASFRFDHRGCGESGGDFVDFTPDGVLQDLDAALTEFRARPEFDHTCLGMVGYSLGGASASYLLNQYPGFVSAVFWAPVAQAGIIREKLSKDPSFEGYRERGYYDHGGWRVSADYLDRVATTMQPLAWIQEYPGSILFLHGENDDIVPPDHSQQYLESRRNEGDQLILVPRGDHGFGPAENFDFVIAKSADWLVGRLRK